MKSRMVGLPKHWCIDQELELEKLQSSMVRGIEKGNIKSSLVKRMIKCE